MEHDTEQHYKTLCQNFYKQFLLDFSRVISLSSDYDAFHIPSGSWRQNDVAKKQLEISSRGS